MVAGRRPRARLRTGLVLAIIAGFMVSVAIFAIFGTSLLGSDVQSRTPDPDGDYLIIEADDLMALPTSGPEWDAMLAVADGDLGEIDLADQTNTNAGRLLAAALVYARTGQPDYRDRVVRYLRQLPTADLGDAWVNSVARQVGGYAIAADLVDYRDPAFVEWMDWLRTHDLGGNEVWYAITHTSEVSAHNWGAWALASRVAISAFLGDEADLAAAANIFRGFTGEREYYDDFEFTDYADPTWACGPPEEWVPINPADCGSRSGAVLDDISRSPGEYPRTNETGIMYSWGNLGGSVVTARVLYHAGYRDVYEWGDRALLRAGEFLRRNGGYPPPFSINQYTPWEINAAYGADLGPLNPAGHGRAFGYTDWLAMA